MFGIVTGIVLPVILFPNTVTNAMASLLLPAVAEAEEVHDYRAVSGAIKKSLEYCLLLGLFSGLVFGVCGNQIGSLLFNDIEAGGYIQSFAILCPLMYIQSLLAGALKWLGKMNETLLHHVIASGYPVIRCGCHDAKNGDLWLYCRCILGQCSSNGYRRGSSVSDCGKNK